MKKFRFDNCKSYGDFGIHIFGKFLNITQYGGKEKNAQHKQYIEIPNRVFVEFAKFYLKYKTKKERRINNGH